MSKLTQWYTLNMFSLLHAKYTFLKLFRTSINIILVSTDEKNILFQQMQKKHLIKRNTHSFFLKNN